MSNGNRLAVAALGLAAILIALGTGAYFGALNAPYHGYHSVEAGHRQGERGGGYPSQIDRDRPGLPDLAERIASGPDPHDSDEREKRDLAAQEASALWAFWLLIVSVAGTLTTVVGTGFLLWQIMLTREAVKDTGDATQAMVAANAIALSAQRPWVAVEATLTGFKMVGFHGVQFDWDVAFTNTGQMMAEDFDGDVKFVPMDHKAMDHIKGWYEQFRGKTDAKTEMALAPRETVRSYGQGNYSLEHLPWFGENPRRCFIILIVMCSFRVPGEAERRFYCRSFAIGQRTEDLSLRRQFSDDLTSLTIDKDNFVVQRFGPGYAT